MTKEDWPFDEDIAKLWRWADGGECLGEVRFDGLAEASPVRCATTCASSLALKSRSRSRSAPQPCWRGWVSSGADAAHEAQREGSDAFLLLLLRDATGPAIDRYRGLHSASAGPPQQVAAVLIAHEEALHAFATAGSPTDRDAARSAVAAVRATVRGLRAT